MREELPPGRHADTDARRGGEGKTRGKGNLETTRPKEEFPGVTREMHKVAAGPQLPWNVAEHFHECEKLL